MGQSIATDANWATAAEVEIERQVDQVLDWLRPQLIGLARTLRASPLTPFLFLQFELCVFQLLLQFGRVFLESILNGLEGDGRSLPHDVVYLGQGYRRLGKKTRNAHVATLFGTICLRRFGYRFWEPLVKESCIFPLELQLGLVEGVTPALAEYMGRCLGEAGATQNRVLQQLKAEHHVSMGVKRLRKFLAALVEDVSEHRQDVQVQTLLDALRIANSSQGNRKPVLAVGRDGITLCEYKHRFWEVATAATVTVFDRAGKRLRTVYLAWRPELGQATMSRMMTDLINQVLKLWHGPLPSLSYIANSGGNESSYFEDALRRMRHPRTEERLCWQRVVDFYHAAQRVWSMAAALFRPGTPAYFGWARRMLRNLKRKPNGPKRVLHSAAAFLARMPLSKSRLEELRKAYRYIRRRTQWMQYGDYKQRHIPLGSGITEAACKTVYTQRLKLSGMRWTPGGAQHILTLRIMLLSGTGEQTYRRSLGTHEHVLPLPYARGQPTIAQKAA